MTASDLNPRNSFLAFDSLAHDEHDVYRVCKDIGGYPEVEGTPCAPGCASDDIPSPPRTPNLL